MVKNTQRFWLRFSTDPATLSPAQIARDAAGRCVESMSRRRNTSFGLNLRSPLPDTPETTGLLELIKVYSFLISNQTFFARSAKLSQNRKQILVDLVESDPDRTRNYFERRAADAAGIGLDVVQAATCLSVAFNTGVLTLNELWTPPAWFKQEHLPTFQLLVTIFTYEATIPVSEEGSHQLRLVQFDKVNGSTLFASMYEHYLLLGGAQNLEKTDGIKRM